MNYNNIVVHWIYTIPNFIQYLNNMVRTFIILVHNGRNVMATY